MSSVPFIQQSIKGIRWAPRIDAPEVERAAQAMAQQQGISEIVARVIAGRGVGIDEAQDFLNPTLKHFLPDPSHLKDMDAAAERIASAITAGEHVAVFGDYDVDGATSTALLKRYFAALGRELNVYIPDRAAEGYGPNIKAFELLKSAGASLILTVDCGTVAFEPIEQIAEQGVDVIVVDHHQAEAQLPNALVVNPNRIDQDSEMGHLAAVGVVFLLLIAVNRQLRDVGYFTTHAEPDLLQWLDMVALGTVCDVVPLKTLNRAFVSQGLKVMAGRTNLGIRALSDIAHLDEAPSTYAAGFVIGPRINAGGRVGEAALGSQILSSDDEVTCHDIAIKLDQYNAERKAIEATVLEQAMAQAETQANQSCIVVASEGWHEGVIGIVAGRLKEHFNRPAAVISVTDGIGKGSARSVSGADMGAAIASAKEQGILQKGGGHSMAAGFSLDMNYLANLQDWLESRLSSAVTTYMMERCWLYDGLVSVSGLTLQLLDQLDQAGPFGMGNPGPKLVIPEAHIQHCQRMKDKHLRVSMGDQSSKNRVNGVCFNVVGTDLGNLLEQSVGTKLHIAGAAKRNQYQGYTNVQFMIEDAAPTN